MKKDIFSELTYDLLDDVKYDTLDEVDLDPEDKILYSPELKELLRDEIAKKIKELPLDKLIKEVVEKQVSSQLKAKSYDTTIRKTETRLVEEIGKTKDELKEDLVKISEELRRKYAEFRNIANSQTLPQYQFGGFAPPNPVNSANNTVLTNVNGTWAGLAWVAGGSSSSNPVYIPDSTTEGSWRLYNDGTNLVAQRLESSVWVEKGGFFP